MTRLELIVMSDAKIPLSADEARALFSDHAEGLLDDETRAQVDNALAADPALDEEYRALHATLALLRRAERPAPPSDMLARVRARLADERRQEIAAQTSASAPSLQTPSSETPAGGLVELDLPRRRFRFTEIALAACAVAAVGIGVFLAQDARDRGGVQAAGVGGSGPIASAELSAPGLSADRVRAIAAASGMQEITGEPANTPLTFEGDRRATARFSVELRTALAREGRELSGFVPDAERTRVQVQLGPAR